MWVVCNSVSRAPSVGRGHDWRGERVAREDAHLVLEDPPFRRRCGFRRRLPQAQCRHVTAPDSHLSPFGYRCRLECSRLHPTGVDNSFKRRNQAHLRSDVLPCSGLNTLQADELCVRRSCIPWDLCWNYSIHKLTEQVPPTTDAAMS